MQLWDAWTSRPLGPPLKDAEYREGSPVYRSELVFRPDSRAVITGNYAGMARLWDCVTGQPLGPFFQHCAWYQMMARPLQFARNGRTVLCYGREAIRLIDPATGLVVSTPIRNGETGDLSPDGRTLLTGGGDDAARLWEVSTGRPLGPPLWHQSGAVRIAKFSADGQTVLTGGDDRTARLWDVAEWPDEWAPDVTLRIEAMTGLALDKQEEVRDFEPSNVERAFRLGDREGDRTTSATAMDGRSYTQQSRAHRPRMGVVRTGAVGRGRSRVRRGSQSPA